VQARISVAVRDTSHPGDASDVIVAALSAARQPGFGSAQARRDLIASSTELQERNLIKMASLAAAIAKTLTERHVPSRIATFAAQSAIAVFTAAYDDWADDTTADFDTLMQRSLADLRQAAASKQSVND
jgi:MftR C-terminal domain